MRLLIVDDSKECRETLTRMLRSRWPIAQIEHWDPRERGHPRAAIASGRYEAVLLDSRPAGQDGYAWTAEIRQDPGAPPVLLIARESGDELPMKAMAVGAADLLRWNALTSARLVRCVAQVLREEQARRDAATGTFQPALNTVQLDVRKIGAHLDGRTLLVPGYRVLQLIGQGGMAQVYIAERVQDGQQVALKVLASELRSDEVFYKRFVQEYQLVATIRNEYVARIFDQGFTGDHPYIAMEYFPGGTLAARIHEGITSLAALRLVAQIAQALEAIHARGIVHRDLKPANILFRADGRPAIVDFGLAKDLTSRADLTKHGQLLATPRYMSPEQCLGDPVDARSDLYSLGVLFYEMLAGAPLFENADNAGIIAQHVHGKVPQLPARVAGYQPILERLLAKRPEDRFESARELFEKIAV